MIPKYRIYSDNSVIAYPSLHSGRKKSKEVNKTFLRDTLKNPLRELTEKEMNCMVEQEIEACLDTIVLTAQPIKTIGEKNNEKGNILSTRARKEIKRLISSYAIVCDTQKQFLNWSTFSVPSPIGEKYEPKKHDELAKNALKEWLKKMKNETLSGYLWVAERQDGKRNDYKKASNHIHFHAVLVWETMPDVKYLNLCWLHELNAKGFEIFVSPERANEIINHGITYPKFVKGQKEPLTVFVPPLRKKTKLIEDFAAKQGIKKLMPRYFDDFVKKMSEQIMNEIKPQNYRAVFHHLPKNVNPDSIYFSFVNNPLDCKKLNNWGQIQSYIAKYITKQDETNRIFCRIWAASREFSSLITGMNIEEQDYLEITGNPDYIYKEKRFTKELGGNTCHFTLHQLTELAFYTGTHEMFRHNITYENEKNIAKMSQGFARLLDFKNQCKNIKKDSVIHDEFSRHSDFEILTYINFNPVDSVVRQYAGRGIEWKNILNDLHDLDYTKYIELVRGLNERECITGYLEAF